jgi:uncharacterized protein
MKRIATLDVLRGFALLGIIFINIRQMVLTTMDVSDLDYQISYFLDATVSHRFYVIFSFLFGVGFYLFFSHAEEKEKHPRRLFFRRLLILFLFGLAHHYFQPGEALVNYSIIGLLLIPFYGAKSSVILTAGILLSVAGCYLGYPVLILGMFLLGHWAGKVGLFHHTERYIRGLRITLIVSLFSILPFYYLQENIMNRTGLVDLSLAIGGLPVSIFYVTALTLLMQYGAVQRLLTPLGKMGRMSLTNYLMQTLIILIIAHLLDWHGNVHTLPLVIVAVCILAVQILFSSLWLRYFQLGPAEYLWRLATYGELFSIRKKI